MTIATMLGGEPLVTYFLSVLFDTILLSKLWGQQSWGAEGVYEAYRDVASERIKLQAFFSQLLESRVLISCRQIAFGECNNNGTPWSLCMSNSLLCLRHHSIIRRTHQYHQICYCCTPAPYTWFSDSILLHSQAYDVSKSGACVPVFAESDRQLTALL